MRFHSSSRALVFGLVLAAILALSLSGTAMAAPQAPATCTKGAFTYTCSNGSERYLVEPPAPVSGQAGNGYFVSQLYYGAGSGGNAYVQVGPGMAMRFKTAQPYGAWWDAGGNLTVVPAVNGTITIPSGAVMVSIPGDILGNFDLPGWIKGQHVETGEYVLGSLSWARG